MRTNYVVHRYHVQQLDHPHHTHCLSLMTGKTEFIAREILEIVNLTKSVPI